MIQKFLMCFVGIVAGFVTHTVARLGIVGAEKAEFQEFPYQVSIFAQGIGYDCGGGIINEQHVLTAAHCVFRNDGNFYGQQLDVIAGTNNLHKPVAVARVEKIFVPAEYTPPSLNSTGDIAVLKLHHPLKLVPYRHRHKQNSMVSLRLPKNKGDSTYASMSAKFAGFGWNWVKPYYDNNTQYSYFVGNNSDFRLRFVETDVQTHDECEREHPRLKIVDKLLCAKSKQCSARQPTGVCTADSGSPLVHNHVAIGVLSFGPKGCSERNSSAIYTRVSHFLTFIRNSVKNEVTKNMRAFVLIRSS